MAGLIDMRGCVDNTFSEENVYMVEGVSLLTFCDVSMLQFMPWRKSRFFVLSVGYPTMRVMNIAMGTKAIQSIVSVVCECEFLRRIAEVEDNPIKSDWAYALFYMNITVGVLTVIMDLLVLCLRGNLLREAEMARVMKKSGPEETENGTVSGASIEMTNSNVTSAALALSVDGEGHGTSNSNHLSQPSSNDASGELPNNNSTQHDDEAAGGNVIAKRSSIDVDLTQIYGDGDREDDVPMRQNPLHDL